MMKRIHVALVAAAITLCGITTMDTYAAEIVDDDTEESDVQSDEVEMKEGFYEGTGSLLNGNDSEDDGVRISGWHQESNGKWRYYENGSYVIGWKKIGGKWYYFDSSTGYMHTGWLEYQNHWYYFEPKASASNYGQMVIGWKKITVSGAQDWYYFNANGIMLVGWQYLSDNGISNWYYFNSNGKMKIGWLSYENHWYFFNSNGIMQTGWCNIQGYTYYFKSNGQYKETTRRAIIISNAYLPSDIELMGWENCLSDMSFCEGGQFEQIETRSTITYSAFCDMIDNISQNTEESDVTYLSITCHGSSTGELLFCQSTSVNGQMLRNRLDQIEGKVVLFLNTCYAGTIINRGESDCFETNFLSSFTGENRSGELVNDKYLVLCSSSKTELSAGYTPPGSISTVGLANKYWMLGGGWDINTNSYVQMYADTDQNSIVTLNELYTYSYNQISGQHVVVYPQNSLFTIFAKLE